MATIASLIVNLGMNTAAFSSAAKGARSTIGGLTSSVSSLRGVIAGLAGAAGLSLTVAGVQSLVNTSSDAIDEMGKFSDRVGVATEQLTGIAHAANLAGVGNEEFRGVFEKMVKTIGDLNAKGGKGAELLADYGLSAVNLAAASPDEAFLQIADAISKIESPTKRATLATTLFGRQGQALLNTLMQGRAAIEAQVEEAKKLGLAYSRLDASRVEAANDAWTRTQGVISGAANEVAIALAPAIETAAGNFTHLATGADDFKKSVRESTDMIVDVAAKALDVAHVFVRAAQIFKTEMEDVGHDFADVWHNLSTPSSGGFFPEPSAELDEWQKDIDRRRKELAFFDENGILNLAGSRWAMQIEEARMAADRLANTWRDVGDAGNEVSTEAADSIQQLIDKYKEQIAVFGMSAREMEEFKMRMSVSNDEEQKHAEEAIRLARELDKLEADKKAREDAAREFTQDQDALKREAEAVRDAIQTPLDKFMEERGRLIDLAEHGFLSDAEAAKGIDLAGKSFLAATDPGEIGQGNAALERGSAAAFSAIVNQPQDRTLTEAKRQTEILKRIELLQRKQLDDQGFVLELAG